MRDESLSRVGARFLPVASWDDLLRDERGHASWAGLRIGLHVCGPCLHGGPSEVYVSGSRFGPSSTFPESCVLDGTFRGDFGAHSGPFSTIEWGTCGWG